MLWLGAVAAHYNCGGIIPAPMKKQIVDLHNELRGKLKNGEVDGEKRKLPRAKNMPQPFCFQEALSFKQDLERPIKNWWNESRNVTEQQRAEVRLMDNSTIHFAQLIAFHHHNNAHNNSQLVKLAALHLRQGDQPKHHFQCSTRVDHDLYVSVRVIF
ncbi:hypothetical protein RB195_004498 [Necator americanus]|uniref:SCP domain-containing protein n=1 Tax=Necator americanus TaxID=51031 RepID=A0ABR1BLZ7_NECAM